jgi:hypothetical protein
VQYETQVEIPESVDEYTRDLSANERHLLALCNEVYFGKIDVVVDCGKVTSVGVQEWTRKLEDSDISTGKRPIGALLRMILTGRPEHESERKSSKNQCEQ